MKVYKGTDKDIKCRGYQFTPGVKATEDGADICKEGFYGCENPLDVWRYYPLRDGNRMFEAELEGVTEQREDGSKRVGKSVTLGAEVGIRGVVEAGVKFIFAKCGDATEQTASGWQGNAAASGWQGNAAASGEQGNAAASGWYGNAAASGWQGNAAASGWQGNAAASGWYGNAAASGWYGNAAASGWQGTATVTGEAGAATAGGKDCLAVAWGKSCRAKGAKGTWLVLAEHYPRKNGIKEAVMVKVDGVEIKADTWYALKGGKAAEV